MRVFDESKTTELFDYDLEKGKLEEHRLFIKHHPAVEEEWKWVKENLRVQVKEKAEEYDEYEDVLVFVPYTEEELEDRRLKKMREDRKPLLLAFDKWEKAVLRGREIDDEVVMAWYQSMLDLEADAFENVPGRVAYYL